MTQDEAQPSRVSAEGSARAPAEAPASSTTSQPEPLAAGHDVGGAQTPSRTRRPMWQRVTQLLMPPVLAAAAVGVHWWLNVPERIRESPNDQGAKKKRSAKDEKKPRPRGRSAQRDEPRTADELEREWSRFGNQPFESEPTRTDWARRHQAIINRAVVVARRDAFEGAPEQPRVVLVDTTCRTVRCRLLLRSPDPTELQRLSASLERLQTKGEPLWRSYAVAPADADDAPPKKAAALPKDAKADHYVQITVAFQTDETATRELEIPAAEGEAGAEGKASAEGEAAAGGKASAEGEAAAGGKASADPKLAADRKPSAGQAKADRKAAAGLEPNGA